jgi:hypothetical protein
MHQSIFKEGNATKGLTAHDKAKWLAALGKGSWGTAQCVELKLLLAPNNAFSKCDF